MAVFRVERNKGYTVMSNHHLRNEELTLKAKGLLSQMLSLPEDWDYTLAGLSQINREKIDAIWEAIKELERAGYIVRSRERDEKGCLRGADYVIYEQPHTEPTPDLPTLENPTKEKINTDLQSTHSIPILSPNPSPSDGEAATPPERKRKEADTQSAYEIYREIIKDNIDYDILMQEMKSDGDRLDEIVDIMLETVCTRRKTIRIAGDDYPAGLVKAKFMKLDSEHIRFVLDCKAAAVVRHIFQSVLAGETIASIAKELRTGKIPIPSEHWKRTGEPVRAAKYADPYAWSATTIGYILKRPEYIGRKVLGKTVCENYKTKSSRKTAPEEQYIFEGAIPAIVDVETWQTVQKIRETVRRAPKRQNTPNRLTGFLYCADCGSKLTHRYTLVQGKYFTRLLAGYDEEQTGLETSIAEWQRQIESWNADKLKTDQFIQLVKRYTDFSELTTPMLNEFIGKVIVHEGEGRGNDRRQRIDIYLNFIGAFEVPAHIVTPAEVEEQRRQQEEQAAKEVRSKELEKARYEKRKAEKREFTARKKAGLLTPEELEAGEKRLAHSWEWQKEWREKRKAAEPPRPPKKKSIKELMELEKTGAELTPEETERLAEHRRKKAAQHKAWRERQKAGQPKARTLKELAAARKEGEALTPEESERLEAHKSRKKTAREKLVQQAETGPAVAAELAKKRAYQSEATRKSRQKMYEEAATGNPEAVERYENYLAARREAYHRKKQEAERTA